MAVAHWRHRLSPSRNLSWGGGALLSAPPPTGAKGKFSLLEHHQRGGGANGAPGPQSTSQEPGRAPGIQGLPGLLSQPDRGHSVPDLAQFAKCWRRGRAPGSPSPVVARGPKQPPRPLSLREGLESDRHGLSRPEYK